MSCTSEQDSFEKAFESTSQDEEMSLDERVEEYRLKRLSKEYTFFGGVRD